MLAVAIIVIAMHVLLLLVSLILSKKKMEKEVEDASFLRYFPSEYFEIKTSLDVLLTSFFVVAYALMAAPLILTLLTVEIMDDSLRAYIGLGITTFAISMILNFLLISVKPSKERAHFMIFVALSFLMAVSVAMEGLVFMSFRSFSISEEWSIAFSIVHFVLSAFFVALPLNPKMRDWYRLEAMTNKDGSVSYKRPKIFILAFSEWQLYGAMSLSFLSSMISYFLMYLGNM